jgi:hypothetical protein
MLWDALADLIDTEEFMQPADFRNFIAAAVEIDTGIR